MTRRYPGIVLCFMILGISSMFGLSAIRKTALDIPPGFAGIIAYGSLISLPSMEETLGHKYAGPIHEVRLKGYERAWACVRPWNVPPAGEPGAKKIDAYFLRGTERVPIGGAAELNIVAKKKGRINAILYLITNEELIRLDKRERGYRRVDVSDRIEEFRFRGGKVFVYEGLPPAVPASPADKGTFILIKEFLDLVTGACESRGKAFREEFDRSTRPCVFPVVSYKDIVWEKAK